MDDAIDSLNDLRQIADSYGLETMDHLPDHAVDAGLLSGFSESWARKNEALPIVGADDSPVLLSARPDCLETLQQAQLLAGRPMRPVLVSSALLASAIERAFGDPAAREAHAPSPKSQVLRSVSSQRETENGKRRTDNGLVDLLSTDVAPVTQLLNGILLDAIRRRASDIHFEPLTDGLRVRFRIDGGLYEQPSPPAAQADAVVSRIKVMARMDIAERRLPQDGMAQVRLGGGRIVDIRVSTVPVADGERVVMRLLDRDNAWLPLEELGMGQAVLQPFSDLIARPHGLVVVSGPTGSGKTTTLYSALSTLDSARRNILTVEDPVEYRLPSIGQIQVMPKIGLTFASGLRHILRQDPDVVLVGETRDSETAEIAVRAALTGHLVFTTLHTNDAPSAVARLADMGIEPYLLASCLRGVLAQRLVRRLCKTCQRPTSVATLRNRFGASSMAGALLDKLSPQAALREAVGCSDCLEGYRGRTGIFEFMGVGNSTADAIRRGGFDAAALRSAATAEGVFVSLADDAMRKLVAGETDFHEVLGVL